MGIQISGLLANQAFDWKSVVDQLVAADGIPIKNLQNQQVQNSSQIAALGSISTAMQALQDSVQAIRENNPFLNRTVSSDNGTSTWRATSTAGAALGSYKFVVSQLATPAKIAGTADIGAGISNSSDVSSLTLASLNTATPITSGSSEFSVNGQLISINSTDTLQAVFDKISTATGGEVTASYDPTTDTMKLNDSSGAVILGAPNDTSNFLQVMKLQNNGTGSLSSVGSLGVISTTATLATADLRTVPTNVDSSGNGSFSINNVSISYNINTDTLTSVLNRINTSNAGVTASYDSVNDKVTLTNKSTGDIGISVSEGAGGLLAALGVTNSGYSAGLNAKYTVNGGPTLISQSNTLDSSSHGITGFSLTVNSETSETLTVAADVNSMQASIQDVLSKFNTVQDEIASATNISVSNGSVQTSVLSSNHEVENWAVQLQNIAFSTVTGISGSITHFDNLGIDFDGTSGHLTVKDTGKLSNALTNTPGDVQAFFLNGSKSMVSQMYGALTNLMGSNSTEQGNITDQNSSLSDQIKTMQTRLDQEREQLTNSFIQMLDAQSAAQSQTQSLTNAFFNNNNNSCWVARAVYGARNPRWILFRHWLLFRAPTWFRELYLRHGASFAAWLEKHAWCKKPIRHWMDRRIAAMLQFRPSTESAS
jgi:flagellar hook-associated protein 2